MSKHPVGAGLRVYRAKGGSVNLQATHLKRGRCHSMSYKRLPCFPSQPGLASSGGERAADPVCRSLLPNLQRCGSGDSAGSGG